MVYRNFILRFIFSTFIFFVYLISLINIYLLISLILIIYIIIFYEVISYFKKNIFLILLYLFISLFVFILYLNYYFEISLFNLFVLTIISFDIFSYIVGNYFGKTYILKYISPNKSLEGYFAGFTFTNLFFIFYVIYFEQFLFSINDILLVNTIIVFAIIGDIVQSFFKRKNNIKDSSNLLPGHGGFFDRFDSFIFAIIFLTTYSYFFS